MADKSSIFKVNIDISNIDQHRYEQLNFTVALEAKETINHLVMRLLAYSMIPENNIAFGHDIAGGFEPDVMVKDYDGHYIYWVDVGFPAISRVKKASHQADNLLIFSVAGSVWLEDYQAELLNLKNVHLVLFEPEMVEQLGHEISRNVKWSMVIDSDKLGITDKDNYLESEITRAHAKGAVEMATI